MIFSEHRHAPDFKSLAAFFPGDAGRWRAKRSLVHLRDTGGHP